jgi:C4-dicarboxylate-specific signal transduction histidine kinase
MRQHPEEVSVAVRDSGPGVAPEPATEVFAHGFTEHGGRRGLGPAMTRRSRTGRGGSAGVHNDAGAVCTARLPVGPGPRSTP